MPASSTSLAFLNGCFIPPFQLFVPVHDAGFVFGATINDMCRTFHHRLYRWPDHLARFRHDCQYAHIPLVLSDDEITSAAENLVRHNAGLLPPEQELLLVLFATPGSLAFYAGQDAASDAPTFAMHTIPLPYARYRNLFTEGAHLIVPQTRHLPGDCVDPRIKHRSRLHWWLAQHEARSVHPEAIPLLLDHAGHVTETAAANFLLVRRGAVIAPPADTVLAGVSLHVLQALCGELQIPFQEQALTVADCLATDEALLTSTPYCLAGVSRINDRPIPWPGPVLQRLQQAWNASVGLDVAGPFRN